MVVHIDFKVSGLESVEKTIARLSPKGRRGEIDRAIDALDWVSKEAFESVYGNTPFINATGRYHSMVQIIRSKSGLSVSATAPYSDCLEVGHGSFGGYHIMQRTFENVQRQLPSIMRWTAERLTR